MIIHFIGFIEKLFKKQMLWKNLTC